MSASSMADKVANVPPEIITYMLQLKGELKNATQEEINVMSEKVFDELSAAYAKHLVGICGHYEGSRRLEEMLSGSQSFVIKFGQLIRSQFVEADILFLVKDKIGSHVLQSFIIESRKVLKTHGSSLNEVIKAIEYISFVFLPIRSANIQEELMTDRFASHVLRSILVTLAGKPIYYEHVFSVSFSALDAKQLEHSSGGNDPSVIAVFEKFVAAFLSSLSIENDDNDSFEALFKLSKNQYSSPIIQVTLSFF